MKFSSIKNLIKTTNQTSVISDVHKTKNINNNDSESSMSPELLETYLKEKINIMQNEIDEARTLVAKCENALAFDDRAAINLSTKIELINKLARSPSKKALKQMDFLKEYIPKLHERNLNMYKKYQFLLQTAENLYGQEIKSCKQKLSAITNHDIKH